MAKSKQQQQKKKERERRVAQEKLAKAEKRAQDQTAQDAKSSGSKVNKLAAAIPVHKPEAVAKAKTSFIRRRSVG